MDVRTRRVVGWTVGVVAIVVAAIGSLAAIPSGGGSDAAVPIPSSATTSLPAWESLDPGHVVPANIDRTILIPASAAVVGTHDANPFGSEFDAWISLRTTQSPRALGAFFQAALPDEGWHISSLSVTRTSLELIASKAGSDGSYWEVGIKDPVAGSPGAPLQVRLLQVSFS